MEPLTEDEWVEILTKYDDTFEKKDIMNDNKVTAKLKKEWQSTCLKEHFTLKERAEIVDRFDVSQEGLTLIHSRSITCNIQIWL